jgi:hypothetical protein
MARQKTETKEEFLDELGTSLYFAYKRRKKVEAKLFGNKDYTLKDFMTFVDNAVDELD